MRKNTSGFKGVSFDKSNGKYKARRGQLYVGSFDTAEEAAQAIAQDVKVNPASRPTTRSNWATLVAEHEIVISKLQKELIAMRAVQMHRI